MREISSTQTHPTNRLQCVGNALIHVQIWITAKTSSKDDSIRKPQSLFLVCLVQLHVAMCPDGIKRLVGSSARPWILGCNYRFVLRCLPDLMFCRSLCYLFSPVRLFPSACEKAPVFLAVFNWFQEKLLSHFYEVPYLLHNQVCSRQAKRHDHSQKCI